MEDIGQVLPGRVSECVPVEKQHQAPTIRTEQRALEVPPKRYSDQMAGVHVLMRQFQQQFIDRFVDVQVVLRRSHLVDLEGTWDQKLSSVSVLVTLMTIHLYQLRFADAEPY